MTASYDLVVVGGGIHGVGVAQAAAAAGHDVLLLEKSALAAGTSSRSSKLIHGGLRYLEHGELRLVRECLRERELLLRLAPEIVKRVWFHIPVYRTTRRRPWQLRAGLSLYALLAGLGPAVRFDTVPRDLWRTLDGLTTEGLQAVFRYGDAQTDDRLLTAAVMRSAQELGAVAVVPGTFVGATCAQSSVTVDYLDGPTPTSCVTRVLVNAAGPWAPRVLAAITPAPPSYPIELVQGAHLVLDQPVERGVYYLEAPQDRRAVFLMPWRAGTLLGTTETSFEGDVDAVAPLAREETYLLEVAGRYFPELAGVSRANVTESFAGLRVLPASGGAAFGRSRETIFDIDRAERPRVVTIYGGKLTAYRATALKTLRRLREVLPRRAARADTSRLPLTP